MRVVEVAWQTHQPAHAGHNRPEVAAGATVLAVEHRGLYFSYAYLPEARAFLEGRVLPRLRAIEGGRAMLAWNFGTWPKCVAGADRPGGSGGSTDSEASKDSRDFRDSRDSEASKDSTDSRDSRDSTDSEASKDSTDSRDSRDSRENRGAPEAPEVAG